MVERRVGVGLISGGLDSTVVAAYMKREFTESHFLFVDYGQKTLKRELEAFRSVRDKLNPHTSHEIDLTWLKQISSLGNSALFDSGTTLNAKNRKLEYVPFRNANMLVAATALAEVVEADTVLIGSTGGDVTCPDNSAEFIESFSVLIGVGTMTSNPIKVEAPLIELDKEGVIKFGIEYDAPFELTWSCHNNLGQIACGQCSNCEARVHAFNNLGLEDSISYTIAE